MTKSRVTKTNHKIRTALLVAGCLSLAYAFISSYSWTNIKTSASDPSKNWNAKSNDFFTLALSHENLDARDSQNRPIQKGFYPSQLRQLFIHTVFSSLGTKDLPHIVAFRKALESIVNPLSNSIRRYYHQVARSVETAYFNAFKRLTEMLALPKGLLLTFNLSIFFVLLFSPIFLASRNNQPQDLPLRC